MFFEGKLEASKGPTLQQFLFACNIREQLKPNPAAVQQITRYSTKMTAEMGGTWHLQLPAILATVGAHPCDLA
jgi:hypothetical protein